MYFQKDVNSYKYIMHQIYVIFNTLTNTIIFKIYACIYVTENQYKKSNLHFHILDTNFHRFYHIIDFNLKGF